MATRLQILNTNKNGQMDMPIFLPLDIWSRGQSSASLVRTIADRSKDFVASWPSSRSPDCPPYCAQPHCLVVPPRSLHGRVGVSWSVGRSVSYLVIGSVRSYTCHALDYIGNAPRQLDFKSHTRLRSYTCPAMIASWSGRGQLVGH